MTIPLKTKIVLIVIAVIANEIALRWAKRELARTVMEAQRAQ